MQDRHQRPRLQLVQLQPAVRRFGIRAQDRCSRGTEAVGRMLGMFRRQTAGALACTVQLIGKAAMVLDHLAVIRVTASSALLPGKRDTWPAERCAGWAWVRNHETEASSTSTRSGAT